jgi:cytochrome c-type biogenesis protein CcmF
MPDLIDAGRLTLGVAFGISILQVLLAAGAVTRGVPELAISARNAAAVQASLLSIAVITLGIGFLARDFSIEFVADHSSSGMPVGLTIAALWGGQEGSLLFWTWSMSVFSAVATRRMLATDNSLAPYGISVLSALQVFFLGVLVFTSSPFQRLLVAPAEGRGLNPLLWDSGMQIHPPMLLMGYMSFGIPFAFATALLVGGRISQPWLREMRNWMLLAWALQSAGLLLGAWWAYRVLGWGGYWGWDPVENVALLPWLVATAYLHSALAQERRGQLRAWTIGLVLTAYALAVFGTFVVRSGVLSSVHSFALSNVGPVFFVFVGVLLITSAALFLYRLPQLRSPVSITAVASKEAGFLLNNLLLLSIAVATFWGTVFPMITEIIQGSRITVGPPFYAQVNVPLFVALLGLMAIWPLLAWRRTSISAVWRSTRVPVTAAIAVSGLLLALGMRNGIPVLSTGLVAAVIAGVALELGRSLQAGLRLRRNPDATSRNPFAGYRRRLGSYVVHLGIAIFALGVIGSSGFSQETAATLTRGEDVEIGDYSVTFENLRSAVLPGLATVTADLRVTRNDTPIAKLSPARRIHTGWETQPTSDVAISTSIPQLDDIYVVLSSWDTTGPSVSLRVLLKPLVILLWIGGVVYFVGVLIVAWPSPQQRRLSPGLTSAKTGAP